MRALNNFRHHIKKHYPRVRIDDLEVTREHVGPAGPVDAKRVIVEGRALLSSGEEVKLIEYSLLKGEEVIVSFIMDTNGNMTPIVEGELKSSKKELARAIFEKLLKL